MKQEDKAVLEMLRSGSVAAFEQLYDKYSGKLFNFLMKFSDRNSYLAEEITQKTFMKIWENCSQINPEKSFISYLCTISKNMLINEYEHHTVHFIYQEYVKKYMPHKESNAETELELNILEDFIDKLTEELPQGRRQIFIMSRKQMLSNKEIAERLKITESTIQTQLSKSLEYMRKKLSQYYDHILTIMIILLKSQ